ncbi:uncharacterized protein LOC141685009 [Apium graveolens]|uniref:uncharacterized protein LOC141685009 n=1 Tax=Apium graveolens TaxID=4045 RepID=UPI003D7A1F6B
MAETKIPLKVVIDRQKKKVVFAEASSDFADILFSFLTLPMGTIVRRIANHSDPSHQKKPIQYFICESLCFQNFNYNTYLNTCSTVKCPVCPKLMRKAIDFDANGEGVFVVKTSSFVISDDLHVIPNNPTSTLGMLESCGINDFAALEENTMKLGSNEILHLLDSSFVSKTPLSDIFLKSTSKILLAHSSEDFVNFLFSLLTVPLGKLISLLTKDHGSLSIENIHHSVSELNVGEYLKSQLLKDMILHPKLLPNYLCSNHIFPLEENPKPTKFLKRTSSTSGGLYEYSLTLDSTHAYRNLIDQSPYLRLKGGFVRGPTNFMVTDELVVTPFIFDVLLHVSPQTESAS